jgi:GntR family transcriptional regulator/MocR family aminotransferase
VPNEQIGPAFETLARVIEKAIAPADARRLRKVASR